MSRWVAGAAGPGQGSGCNIRNNLLIWKYFTDCSVSCPRRMGKKCGFLGWVGWKLKMSKHSPDDWYEPTFKLYAPHKTLPCPQPRPPSTQSITPDQIHTNFDMLNLRTTLSSLGSVLTQSNCSGSAILHPPAPHPRHISSSAPPICYWVISYSLNMICRFIMNNLYQF